MYTRYGKIDKNKISLIGDYCVGHAGRRVVAKKLTARGLLLFLSTFATHADPANAGQKYVAGTITFSNQLPTGVLIYKCLDLAKHPGCTKQRQLENSGYITPVPIQYTQTGDLDPAPQAFLYEMGDYVLWQLDSQNPASWNSCRFTINGSTGMTTSGQSQCAGLSWVNQFSTDPVISLNTYNKVGYIFPPSYGPQGSGLNAPPYPRLKQPPFGARQFVINYKGSNSAICLNTVGTFNSAPCTTDPNDITITQSKPYTFIYGKNQNLCNPSLNQKCPNGGKFMPNSAFVVSGVQFTKGASFTPVGQASGTNPITGKGFTDYGGRFEFTFYPQASPATDSPQTFKGGTLSTGVSTIDMSLVNGYNFGFRLYPNQPTICALAHEENGKSHYNMWQSSNAMSSFSGDTKYCPSSQIVKVGAQNVGCQSDGTYASNTNSPYADQYNCAGAYNTGQTCPPPQSDPAPYGYTPAKIPVQPNPWRPYSQNLGLGVVDAKNNPILLNAYTWAYEDFRGTFTCDGDAESYTLDIYDPQ